MKFKKLLAMAGTAIMSSMALSAPVLAASVTELQNVYDLVSVSEDNTLDFPLFVYGASASIEDFVTATEAAAKFQTFAVVTEEVMVDGATEVVTGGIKFEQSGEALVTGEPITDEVDSLGKNEMDILGTGTFVADDGSSYTYNQYIDFGDDIAVEFYNENDNDIAPVYMARIDDNEEVYTYSLEFPSVVEYDVAADDLEGATIDWLGSTWTILDVTEAADVITAMELISGRAVQTVVLNTPATFGTNGDSYTVELIAVNIDENKATINVDGVSYVVDEGVTETLSDGTSVTVTDIFASSKESTPDSCKVYVGARKVVLTDGDELEVEDDDVDETLVTINSAADELSGWEILVNAEDEIYLHDGDEFVDVIADGFALQYTGYGPMDESDWTNINFDVISDERVEMQFTNRDGFEITVPVAYTDGAGAFEDHGEDADEVLVLAESGAIGTYDIEEDFYFFVTKDNGQFTHLFQVDSIDTDEIKLENVGSGESTTISVTGTTATLRVNNEEFAVNTDGTDMNIDMNSDADYGDDYFIGGDIFVWTEFGTYSAGIQFEDLTGGAETEAVISVMQYLDDGLNQYSFDVEASHDGTDVELDEPDEAAGSLGDNDDPYGFSYVGGGQGGLLEVNDDVSLGSTSYGTHIEYDSDSPGSVDIMYPAYQVSHSVYVGDALSVSAAAGGSVTTQTFMQPTDFSRLDTQITETDKANRDMVLWGGPCVNTLVAGLDAFTYTCDTWPAENFGYLQLINGAYAEGRTVLVAAGTRAADTQLVGDVLADGTKIEGVTAGSAKITGTAVSNVVVE